MGTPTRQDINSTWLFDELTEEFSEDMTNSMAPSNPLVQPEAACAAPRQTVSSQEEESFLQSVFEHVSVCFPELALTMAVNSSGSPVLTITQKNLFNHPPFGLTSHIQVVVQYSSYTASVLMRTWKVGEVRSVEDIIELSHDFSNKSVYKFCPGIDPQHYEEEYHEILRFHIKSVRLCQFPFIRVDSIDCKLWFIPASNVSAVEKSAKEVKCPACKRLIHDLNRQKKRTVAESPSRKIKRQLLSSRARLQYMSPASQKKRKLYAQYERTNSIRKLEKYEDSELVLDEEQNEEMCAVMEAIQPEELKKLFEEGDQHGVGNLMKNIWFTDKQRQNSEFSCDQVRNSKFFC